ncbi:MAG: hypothetical protein JNG88_01940 [Phycisphaerales bacterium]|nr:hypothetical protein [Phycisphaerales bacterium]
MNLSIHKKRLIGLLTLLAAVVVWWQWPTMPQKARGAVANAPPPPLAHEVALPEVDTAELLRRLTHAREPHDVFADDEPTRALFGPPSSAVAAAHAPPLPAPDSQPTANEHPETIDLAHAFRLDGVIVGQTPLASINGKLYRKGAIIEGYRVSDIGRDFVRLEKESRDFILALNNMSQK